jgi:DNA-binding CsgD family transcriptional regulator
VTFRAFDHKDQFKPHTMNTFTITHREQEILELIAYGLSSKEIADKLFISIHTVLTHRKKILKKLNQTKAIGAINVAVRSGILPAHALQYAGLQTT